MAWPFLNVVAPTLDTGPGQDVPTTPTSITASNAWLLGAVFKNASGADRTVTLTNTAGDVLDTLTLPDGAEMPWEWAFRPSAGVKWSADGIGVTGQVWGYS